jgi:hypothetical protein
MHFASIHCHASLYTCPTFLLDSPFPRRRPTRQQQDYQANTVAVPTVRAVPNSTRSPLDFPISLPFPFRSLSSPIDADVEADVGPTASLSLSPSHQAVHSLDNPIAMRRAPSPAPHPPLSRAHSVTPANGHSTGASGQETALSRGPSLNRQGSVAVTETVHIPPSVAPLRVWMRRNRSGSAGGGASGTRARVRLEG